MPGAITAWIPRASVALLAAIAVGLAWCEGGGADARVPAPRPDGGEAPASDEETASRAGGRRGSEAYEVKVRLVDALRDARIEAASLAAAQPYFQTHWRKLQGPWARPTGVAGELAVTVALRNAGSEAQYVVPTPDGRTWTPQARVWNMNEGSFDQREAIYAPTPATIAFRLNVPQKARLRVSPAVALPLPLTTVFDVSVIDAGGVEHGVSQTRIPGGDARRWVEVDADLEAWGGQKVDLVLRTWTDRPAANERRPAPANADDRERAPDGGVAGPPPVPPMSLAIWGDPLVVGREPTRVPYDVLWIVVDALRPDVIASWHDPTDDAAKLAAHPPPLEALLPLVPGLMPSIDRLAARGVQFTRAWSAGSWTRPGTLAMLAGARSSELGIDPTAWLVPSDKVARFYASRPPLVPLALRKNGVTTAAFVNNFFMTGYAAVGLDMGFDRVTDHRYRTRDTAEITHDTLAWLDAHARDRFFLFVNYNSPHEPYDPPKEMLARVPAPPAGPRDREVRAYMAEAAKDDAAIGALLDKLDALDLTRSTLVVVTSDHGETLSAAHDGIGLGGMPLRFHHAVGNFEETARVPLVMALPGVMEGGRAVTERARSIDIAPTVLEIEGLEADPRTSGQSLMSLVRGGAEAAPRVVVTEGRASRAVLWDRWRLIVHDAVRDAGPAEDELYDVKDDPGERRNVARAHPDVVAEMHARLAAALANVPAADTSAATAAPAALPVVHLRFAGAGRRHRIAGAITAGDGQHGVVLAADAVGAPPEAVRVDGPRVDFALATAPDRSVGVDLRVDPPGAPLSWQLFLDDAPWPEEASFAGPFGLPAVAARTGIDSDEARAEVYAASLPLVDPARDLGVFITRDKATRPAGHDVGGRGPEPMNPEMQRVLEEWGYAHGAPK